MSRATKLIVAREDGENNFLTGYRREFAHLEPVSHGGPLVLVDGTLGDDDVELAARILARYSQGREAPAVTVRFTPLGGEARELTVPPLPVEQLPADWHL